MAESNRRGVPDATVGRLPGYLQALTAVAEQGRPSISSEELARLAGVRSAQVRKDLSHLGSYGVRGVGYDVTRLAEQVSAELGLSQDWPVVIVGMGNLGRALASYEGLATRGFHVVALADNDPQVVGSRVEGMPVQPLSDLSTGGPVSVGVITTPPEAAQEVADVLVGLGVHSILTFAPGVLQVPPDVDVRRVDLATELQILTFHQHQREVAVSESQVEGVS
ncbi:MAG: redox-sensing transcriptional repressor Rex [Arsenicicoccus sp.]|uniref:redox-sensing transcriptional repressor Rex n=1 Tax=Serinicoccus profundi TaxID=1078471 RepID=UPI000255EC69|nr:redox-sensing transcriptional repressor Rex [Serinicoccus profundi]PZU50054.1 MAG: redox-sensing transcriptional repressor Rex [Arsenicicoccus sp.]